MNWRSISCQLLSLLLIYALFLQLVPRVIAAPPEHPKSSPVANGALESEKSSSTLGSVFNRATGAIESLFAPEPVTSAPLPVPTPTPANGIAIVRHAPSLNGTGRVEGALRQLTGESVILNGGAVITNDLQVPGTPTLLLNGTPTFGGTIQGTGSAQPTNYQVTLNGTSTTVLGHLVNRTDPITLTNVAAPPASSGTRSVTITAAGQSAGNFATLRDLTLNGNVGMYSIPAGTYRNFIANSSSGFILGVSGATQAAVYNMSSLTLNGSAQFQVIGPVILNLGGALTVNAAMGSSSNPAWLKLQMASGGLTLNSGSVLNAVTNAPASTVIINASSQLIGTLTCDRLTINGGGLLRLTDSAVNQAPTVNAGGNQTITLPSGASLNGSATDDGLPTGSTLTTTWSKISGPGIVGFANANSAVTTATFSQAGTYVVRLTASDSQLSNFSNATVTVLPQNFPPSVSAGPDRIITQPGNATLNGSASDDGLPAGSSLSLLWTKVGGPGTVTFTNPNAAVSNASFSAPGAYTLRLTASDSQLSNFDEVSVTVNPQNQAPNVNAGADQSITLPSSASLHGMVTDDGLPTGSSVTVTWSKLSGPGIVTFTAPNSINTNASFSVAGDYTLQLTASDTALSNHDEVLIHVAAQNHAPIVDAGPDQTITLPNTSSLNGSVSDDGLPAGSSVSTSWTKVSGPGTVTFANGNVTMTTVSFSTAGTYVLRLTANDSQLSASDDVAITVIAENHAPSVDAGASQTITLPNSASLNGDVIDDGLPAGSTLTSVWTKSTGPGMVSFANASSPVTTASFSASGTYELRLTANDSELSTYSNVVITVIAENHAPTANAGTDQTITLPNTANLNGSASDDGLPAGSTLTTVWSKVSGPGTVTFGNPNVSVTTAAFSVSGSYVLRLAASDSELTAADDITIIVIDSLAPPAANFVVPQSTGTAGAFVVTPVGSNVEALLDNDIATLWSTPGIDNQFATLQFFDQQMVFIDRVRLQSANGLASSAALKDFDVQISSTDSNDASFATVFSGTLLNNGQLQEFVFPGGPARARFIKLLLKNRNGSPGSIQLATFNPVAVGSVDNIISLPGQGNAALSQSPSLIANGAAIYESTYPGPSANGLLGYNNGGWIAPGLTNQFATIQLAGGKVYTLDGVKLATDFVSGFGSPTAVKDFEVWVSTTTPDAASFTRVLSASSAFVGRVQTFMFPGGPVQAKYVRYVPLNNFGGGPTINTLIFDVIAEGGSRVVGLSGEYADAPNPAAAAFDGDRNSYWYGPNAVLTNVWVKTALADNASHRIYGVRINPIDGFATGLRGPKDFDIRVSTTTTDDSAFTTVYSGTLIEDYNTGPQQFLFNNVVDARYVEFYWKNSYSTSAIGVSELEVLAAPDRGSSVVGFSSGAGGVEAALDLDPTNQPWVTPNNQNTNVWFKLLLPRAELTTISHIALRPAIAYNGNYRAPKDFELQVSTTDAADSSLTTVFAGTLADSAQMQDFYFAPVQARYVRLLLLKGPNDTGSFALHNFLLYSSDATGTTTRFMDRSSDSDGQIVSWAWNFGDGTSSTLKHPTHTFAQPGDYTVSLSVTDNSGLTGTYSSLYHVVASLNPDFALSPMIAHEGGESVRFTDLADLFSVPTALRQYDFGDGSDLYSQYARTIVHTFQDSGVFHVTLKVGDALGVSHTVTKDITVLNLPPVVDIDPGKTLVWGEEWTSVPRISDQSSVDSATLQGQWDFGDGQTVTCVNCTNANATVTHAYSNPGTYTAVLTITDKDGAAAADSAVFTVNKRPISLAYQETTPSELGQPVLLRVRLMDSFTNQPLVGRTIQFQLNGAAATGTTDANGYAEAQVTFAAGLATNTATATFAEDGFYLGGSTYRVLAGAANQQSCTGSSTGTDFWLMFPGNYLDAGGNQGTFLEISSEVNTTGTVTIPGQNFSQNFAVAAHTTTQVLVNEYHSSSDQIEARGIHLVSQQPVTVYGLNNVNSTVDAFLGLPTAVLGKNYVVLGYQNGGAIKGTQFGIVASANATTVTITPTVTVGQRAAGVPYNITLNQGQTYLLRDSVGATSDLSGTIVLSDKPIGVFGGHQCANIPVPFPYCDYIVEQLPPTDSWGTHFATLPLATRTKGDTFRFLAATNDTHVFLNGSRIAILNRGQYFEKIIEGPAEVTSDYPILLAQYSNSHQYDNGLGDPFMMLIPPLEHYLNAYTVTSLTGFNPNLINVVAPTSDIGFVVLDGTAIPGSAFVPIGTTGVSGAQLTVSAGTHTLSGPHPFGVYVYGFNIDVSYGYPGSACLSAVLGPTVVTLAPKSQNATPGAQTCITATVKDQGNTPVNNQNVTFTITGAHPQTPPDRRTNELGQAQLCYASATAGDDLITARNSSSSDTATVSWRPINQPPVVDAGTDQTVTQPAAASLQGSASDDGQPTNTLTVSWSKVNGPGSVTFGVASAAATTATFDAAGVYVLRLTASDTSLSASDDVQMTVNAAPVNQPPTANAGPDQTVALQANLITNGGSEDLLVNGEIPGWTEVQGANWTQGTSNSGVGFPNAQRGSAFFFAGDAAQAELRQDVDVSAFAANIDAGTQQFELKAYMRSANESLPDEARAILEYREATNTNVIGSLDSGEVASIADWHLTEETHAAPSGTRWIRVRLLATRNSGATNDAFFDSVSLRPVGNAAVKLNGAISDDGLPTGSTLSASWTAVSGPAPVTFSNPNAAQAAASFTTAGTYVLRLTAGDGQLSASDDVTVTVNPANQAPIANAGANQTITLPAAANLNGTASDDGQPSGSSVSVSWSKASGPGTVTFANATSAITTASFSAPGNYVLRLSADDSEYEASAAVTITVNPEGTQVNQPPAVNPGPNQTISLPADTVTLNGTATDDGLPAGSTLTVTWTQISGPGVVAFGNANSAVTTAQFSAVGSYVLRLSASDGAYTSFAEVGVILNPQNQPPTVNAGPDQTTILSQGAQLDGSAGDDGLPAGSSLTTTWTSVSGPGTVAFDNPNVTITGAHFSVTGTYVLRLTASDGALSTSDEVAVTVNDNVAPPTVEITAPSDGSSVTGPTIVTGSVSGGAWLLEYSLDSDDNTNNRVWTTFASGNGAVSNGQLGTLDPTMMLNGLFDIRLAATDSYGQTSRTSISVIVERNLKVGNFTVSFSDLNIPVAGVPMEVTRTYDSRDKRVGDFGFGWTMGLRNIRLEKARVIGLKWYETRSDGAIPNYCLQATGSHLVTVTFPGGKVFKFEASVSPQCKSFAPITAGTLTFTPLAGTHGTLEIVGSADFQVDGSIPGPVNLIGFGGGVDIFNSSLFKFTAEDGTAFIIDQRTGLQSIADTNNNTVTVSAGGIIHSSGGMQTNSISFTRDSLGRISSVIDPAGNAQTYAYDSHGDLVSYTDNENNTSTYTYDANHRLLTIHDPRGIQPIRNDYDTDGRLISHTDGFGKVITYLHDLPARTETITDRLGHPTVFEYDERGNVLTKTDARGGVTTFTYDANDNVLTETNALGKTTTYTYDANDHRTSITDPLNNVTQFTYNTVGKVLTTTDALNHVTTNTYDSGGNLLTTKDALNNTTSFGYGVFDGQRTSMTDALNNTTSYTYTSGYLTKETDALSHETTFTYGANGNRASQSVQRTNALGQLETITTSYEYDKLNRLKKTTFADASFTRVEYNSIGQQSATIDQLGHRTEFTYDDMGRLTRTDYPDGTHEETTYDAEGRRLTSKDRAAHITAFSYDELGRLTRTTYPDGKFTSTAYDAISRIASTTDARGNTTTYEYEPNCGCSQRRSKVTDALGHITAFAYDANGNQISMTDALGHLTTFEYDATNRRKKTIYADSTFDRVAYDPLGRMVSKTDQAGKITESTYDALGRLTKVKDALNQETTYSYNEVGQQLTQTDALNHTTRYEHDQLGRRKKRILPAGQSEVYSYLPNGRLQHKVDFNGKTTTYGYDVMSRLLNKTPDPSLNQPNVTFSYTVTGQRLSMTDASGTTLYGYDDRNRLVSKQTPQGALTYVYDEASNLLTTRSSNTNGVSVDYSYDVMNRLASVKDNDLPGGANTTGYTYDDVGNLHGYSYPNAITTSFGYNSLNRLTAQTVGNGSTNLAAYNYVLGAAGNRLSVTELTDRTVNYTYDSLYRLTNETITGVSVPSENGSISYAYDAVGNRLSRTSTLAALPSLTNSYDDNDRLISDSYDNNGNTVTATGTAYAYDFENRLTSVNSGSVSFVYDGDGNRVAKTVNGITTRYLVDSNNPTSYPQVVDEITGNQVTRTYTYGHSLINQRQLVNSQWLVSFYGYDGQGSVRLLTDFSGAITDTYTYDAFGNLIASTGNTPNEHLYAGEQLDANLGFYYLRSRYLNPSSGRFWTMDTYEGSNYDPLSLHKYAYVGADPINKADPTGQSSIAEELVTLDVSSIISTMSTIRNIAIAAAIACTLDFAVTGLLNEADISIGGSTPCDAPNRPEKKVYFAHGTSLLSAIAIETVGVEYEAIIGGGRGSEVPGAFFTFLLEPSPPLAIELAGDFALRKDPPHAVIIGKLPQSVFERLRATGAVYSSPLGGAEYEETVFLPQSFRALNYYNRGRWEILPR